MATSPVQFADDVSNPFGAPAQPNQQQPAASQTPPAQGVQYAEDASNPFSAAAPAQKQGDQPATIEKVASDPNNIPLDSYAHATERGLANIGQGVFQAAQATGQVAKGVAKSLNPFSTPEARQQAATDLTKSVVEPIKNLPSQAVAVAKNPPSLKDIGDVAGITAGNVIPGVVTEQALKGSKAASSTSRADKAAAPIKATVPEAATQPSKAVLASDKLYQAVAPTKTDTGFRANVHVAAGDLAQVADKIDWDTVRGGKGITRGSAPPDMRVRAAHDAVNAHMGEMYQTEVEPKIAAVQNTPANLAPNPEAYSYLAQTAGDEATRALAAKAAKNPQAVTVAEAYQLAKTVNAELNSFERLDAAQQYQVRATNPGINKLNGLDETLNKTINGALQSKGLPGIQNFERRYAAMAAVRRNLAGRMNEVELRRQGLMDRTVGKVAKAAMGRNVNAIASASAASLADVNVGDYVEKAFKDLKSSGVKPQLDAQPSAPNLSLSPSGSMPPAAQRPLSFMESPSPAKSGPVFPGGQGAAPAPKTSGGTSVLAGEKTPPVTSSPKTSGGHVHGSRVSSGSPSTPSPQQAVEAGGGKFLGHNEVGTWFNEPKSGSTLLIEKGKPVTPEAVRAKIAATQNKFSAKAEPARINGSGESEASLEALSRKASDDAKGVRYFRVDTRSGNGSPIQALRAEDLRPGPHEAIVKQHPDGSIEELSTGDKARRYNFKPPKPPQSVKPGLMRGLSKAAGAEEDEVEKARRLR